MVFHTLNVTLGILFPAGIENDNEVLLAALIEKLLNTPQEEIQLARPVLTVDHDIEHRFVPFLVFQGTSLPRHV